MLIKPEDYTDSQTAEVRAAKGVTDPKHAEIKSARAEQHYKERWGPRSRFVHVKMATLSQAPFHFSNKWVDFLKFKNNITVFYDIDKPIGWLYHKEVSLVFCPSGIGFDLSPACKLRPIEDFKPDNAS